LITGTPPAETTRLNVFTGPVPAPFDAERFTLKVPDAVGVPLITPDVVLMLNPAGSPLAVKPVGLFVAVIVTLYDVLTVAPGSDVLLITGTAGAALITRLNCFTGPVPAPFDAERLTVNVPDAVGVPLITPDVVLMLNPAGNPLALKLVGVLVAVIVTV
jgi:hypothetical protein